MDDPRAVGSELIAMPQTFGAHLLVGGYRIDHKVLSSIQDASRKTGVSFSFLMAQAGRESAFNAQAANRRSSASGLYQFTNGTWLEVMKKHGAAHGYADLAAAIKVTGDGDYEVTDPAQFKRIQDLRRDPGLSAVMAGEYANDNRAILEDRMGRPVNSADLYLAHFLGPQGATHFLKAMEANPHRPAANFVPTAAHVNPRVFNTHGRPADLATVYGRIRGVVENARHYTHLEGVPAWEAMFTENISLRPTFASAQQPQPAPPNAWMQPEMDEIERQPVTAGDSERHLATAGKMARQPARVGEIAQQPDRASGVESWIADVADSIEPAAQAAPAPPPTPAFAARRLAEVATLVPTVAAAQANAAPPAETETQKTAGGFHTLWLSLFGRGEV